MPAEQSRTAWVELKVTASLFVPAVFWAVYQPINSTWTVRAFGCGCIESFNANDLNTGLALAVLLLAVLLFLRSTRGFKENKRRCRVSGLFVLVMSSLVMWGAFRWM